MAVLAIERSTVLALEDEEDEDEDEPGHVTEVTTVLLVLLLRFSSLSEVLTIAVLKTVSVVQGLETGTVKETMIFWLPGAIAPSVQRTCPLTSPQRLSDAPALKVNPLGGASVTITLFAVAGPALLTVSV